MTAPNILEWEASLPIRPSSAPWVVASKAIYGLPMSPAELSLFRELSGGVDPPAGGVDECLAIVGRRGGKSEFVARLAVYEAVHGGHARALALGQIGLVLVIAALRAQAAEVMNYAHGLVALAPLRRLVVRDTDDSIEFRTRVALKITTCDVLSVSGPTVVCAIRDEFAKHPGEESATPDYVVDASLRPALAPVEGAPRRRIISITSAFVSEGLAFKTDRECFGRPGAPVLVLHGTSSRFNPSLSTEWLERERARDPAAFAREYEGEWMSAVTVSWFGASAIQASTDLDRVASLPFEPGRRYVVATDAAFARDNFAIAVATSEQLPDAEFKLTPRRTYLAHIEVLRPSPGQALSPRECVERTVAILRKYQTETVYLDQWCAPTLIESFADRRCTAKKIDWTGAGVNSKAARYRSVREAMADGAVRLPNDPALLREFHRVRGHTTQSGHEKIEALGVGVDDRVSATVMACSVAMGMPPSRAVKDETWWEKRQRQENDLRLAVAFGGGLAPF